jgi:hypothetical protein
VVGKPEKKSLGRPWHKWKDNIKMGRCALDSTGSGYEPVAGSGADGNKLSGSLKCWGFAERNATATCEDLNPAYAVK